MKLQEQDGPRVGWVNPALQPSGPLAALINFFDMTLVIAELEIRQAAP